MAHLAALNHLWVISGITNWRKEQDVFVPAQVKPKAFVASFANGEIVRHPIFGIGRILEVYGSNDKASVKVNFSTGGVKSLLLAYAKLEKA